MRLARLRMIEQSAPWKTPVSDLLKFYKRDDEIRAVKSPVLQRFYRESHLCMLQTFGFCPFTGCMMSDGWADGCDVAHADAISSSS